MVPKRSLTDKKLIEREVDVDQVFPSNYTYKVLVATIEMATR